jgi:hypothetical protein
MIIGKAYIFFGVIAFLAMLGNVIVGGILGILAILLYFVHRGQVEREQAEIRALMQRKQAKQNASRPAPEPLPADGSLPPRKPGETEAEWAGRVQAAEAAAFKRNMM